MSFRSNDLRRLPLAAYALRFVAGFMAVVALSAAAWPILQRHYEAPATIVLLTANRGDDPTATIKATPQPPDENQTQSDVDLISSPDLSTKVIMENQLLRDREFNGSTSLLERIRNLPVIGDMLPPGPGPSVALVRQKLMQHLTINRDRRSYTVSFGYWSEDAQKATMLTQSLLNAYVELQRRRKQDGIDRVTTWLSDRVAHLREQTNEADAAAARFREKSGLADSGADAFLDGQLNALGQDYATARAQEINDGAHADVLERLKAEGRLEDAPDVIASTTVQKLKENRAAASIEPGRLNSESRASTELIAREADHIVVASATQALLDRQRLASLARAIDETRTSIRHRAEAKLQLEVLERDAKANRSVLEESLVRLNGQTSLALSIAPSIDVMAYPEPPLQATFPNPILTALATLLLASLTGSALALRYHMTRGRIRPQFVSEVAPHYV